MSGTGGPGMEQGRWLLVWFQGNYKKVAAALGGGSVLGTVILCPGAAAAGDNRRCDSNL